MLDEVLMFCSRGNWLIDDHRELIVMFVDGLAEVEVEWKAIHVLMKGDNGWIYQIIINYNNICHNCKKEFKSKGGAWIKFVNISIQPVGHEQNVTQGQF